MKAILALGIAGTVLGFLVGILGQFPVDGGARGPQSRSAVTDQVYSKELAEEAGRKFESAYTWVISDLASYQQRPDYERAERQRRAMNDYAAELIPQFKELADTLQGKLDELALETEDPGPAPVAAAQ